jgi:Zn-dependent M28 family amino/carboxypeptidase
MRATAFASVLLVTVSLAACQTTGQPTTVVATQGVSESQLLTDLRILSADDMGGRDTGSAGGEAARNYILARFEALGVGAMPVGQLQPWKADNTSRYGAARYDGVNVIGLIPGTRTPDRYIVVTAHYDHMGAYQGRLYNGADDNASGVASMLELAARLKADPPEHSVLLVALDGEERGLLGARHFVERPPVPLSSIAMNLNLDMTARVDSGYLWVTGTYQNPQFLPLVQDIEPVGRVRLAFGKDTPNDTGRDNWINASDHAAFHHAGLPFLLFSADYHTDYHEPTDDFERIDPATYTAATELIIQAFRALDTGISR